MGYDAQYVITYANFALQNTVDSYRIEVLNTMISIARGVTDGQSNT